MSANDIFAIPYRKGDESVLVVFIKENTIGIATALGMGELSVTKIPYKNDYLVVTTNSNGKNHGICASEGDAIVRNLTTGEICLVPRKHFDVEYKAYDN